MLFRYGQYVGQVVVLMDTVHGTCFALGPTATAWRFSVWLRFLGPGLGWEMRSGSRWDVVCPD
jgi:hypothetical protein